jgi:hypothetical protein
MVVNVLDGCATVKGPFGAGVLVFPTIVKTQQWCDTVVCLEFTSSPYWTSSGIKALR